MKKILILSTIFFLSTTVRAEYNGYHIRFELETTKGETKFGFVYVASAYLKMDSLKNTNYLKKALDQSWGEWNKRDSLVYFKERIEYKFRYVGDSLGEENSIYSLANKQAISANEIKSITITEMIEETYLVGVSSPLSISDTIWTNREPLSSYSFSGYLCYHQIYVHISSKKTDRIIDILQRKEDELKDIEIVVIITECTC